MFLSRNTHFFSYFSAFALAHYIIFYVHTSYNIFFYMYIECIKRKNVILLLFFFRKLLMIEPKLCYSFLMRAIRRVKQAKKKEGKKMRINWKLNVLFFAVQFFNSCDLNIRAIIHRCTQLPQLLKIAKLEYSIVCSMDGEKKKNWTFFFNEKKKNTFFYRQVVLNSFLLFSFFIIFFFILYKKISIRREWNK